MPRKKANPTSTPKEPKEPEVLDPEEIEIPTTPELSNGAFPYLVESTKEMLNTKLQTWNQDMQLLAKTLDEGHQILAKMTKAAEQRNKELIHMADMNGLSSAVDKNQNDA